MMQLDLFNDTHLQPLLVSEKDANNISRVESHVTDTKKSTDSLLETHKYNFQYDNYSSYKISVEQGKISKVYFSIWKYKFLVHLDGYSFVSKDMSINHYYEPDSEERDTTVATQTLQDLRIKGIQKKESAWYGAFKEYVEYFKFAGIKYSVLKKFLESLLKQYHKN